MPTAYPPVAREKSLRLVVMIPQTELERLDRWAIAQGMPSRTAAVRSLLADGVASAEGAACQTS